MPSEALEEQKNIKAQNQLTCMDLEEKYNEGVLHAVSSSNSFPVLGEKVTIRASCKGSLQELLRRLMLFQCGLAWN